MLNRPPLTLSTDFKNVLDLLEHTNQHVFLTGRAGTGKSTLLRLFRQTTKKNIAVLAPTGIAALNVGGQTIHSFFSFPGRPLTSRDIRKSKMLKVIRKLDALVIDEISMVRADLLDAINHSLQLNRSKHTPFGGVQMIMIGDLFQLPPVVASSEERQLFQTYYDSPYFFSAKVLAEENVALQIYELGKVYRQDNRHFLRLLDGIRLNRMDEEDLFDLNERHLDHFEAGNDAYITLTTRNYKVDRINQLELGRLEGEGQTYLAQVTGTFDPRLYPAEAALVLKKGAQVMFIKNDPEGEFVNGTIGRVQSLSSEKVVVIIDEGDKEREVTALPLSWEVQQYQIDDRNPNQIKTEVLGTFKQLPLRLAWAVTIHKAQGQTFDHVIIDLDRGAFETGQTYVALSRCRTLEGIVLSRPLRQADVLVDERIVQYYETYF